MAYNGLSRIKNVQEAVLSQGIERFHDIQNIKQPWLGSSLKDVSIFAIELCSSFYERRFLIPDRSNHVTCFGQ